MWRWLRAVFGSADGTATQVPAGSDRAPASEARAGPEPVEIPITDALDLHPFRPNETADVVRSYLDEAIERGLREVRIIHGRGIGTQREIVRGVLQRDPRVIEFADAPPERGGWGATVATLGPASRGPA